MPEQIDRSRQSSDPPYGVTSRRRQRRAKPAGSALRTIILVFGVVMSGMIGLAAGCFVLFLVNPQHPLVTSISRAVRPVDEAVPTEQPARPAEADLPTEVMTPRPSVVRHHQTLPYVPPAKRPTQEAPRWSRPMPIESPSLSERSPSKPVKRPKSDPPGRQPVEPAVVQPAAATPRVAEPPRQQVPIDFSRTVARVALAKEAGRENTEVCVEGVSGLGTPCELRPADGVLRRNQPIDVVLPDYQGVTIRLSLQEQPDAVVLETAATIDTALGKRAALSMPWVKRLLANWSRDADNLGRQLLEAKTAANQIEIWLRAPGSKSIQLRGERRRQLAVLQRETIPALEKQVEQAQAVGEQLQKLFRLVELGHDTACIDLVFRTADRHDQTVEGEQGVVAK